MRDDDDECERASERALIVTMKKCLKENSIEQNAIIEFKWTFDRLKSSFGNYLWRKTVRYKKLNALRVLLIR